MNKSAVFCGFVQIFTKEIINGELHLSCNRLCLDLVSLQYQGCKNKQVFRRPVKSLDLIDPKRIDFELWVLKICYEFSFFQIIRNLSHGNLWNRFLFTLILECVNVSMPAHRVLPLTRYIFEASFSTSAAWSRKSMTGIAILTYN